MTDERQRTGDAQVDGRSLAQEAYEKYREWKYEAFPADEPHPRNRTSWAELDPREQDVWRSVVTLIATAERLAVQRSEAALPAHLLRPELDAMIERALEGGRVLAKYARDSVARHRSEVANSKVDGSDISPAVDAIADVIGEMQVVAARLREPRTAEDQKRTESEYGLGPEWAAREALDLISNALDNFYQHATALAEPCLAEIRELIRLTPESVNPRLQIASWIEDNEDRIYDLLHKPKEQRSALEIVVEELRALDAQRRERAKPDGG